MNVTSTLPKRTKENLTPDSPDLDINDLVKSASRAIAPLWPIATFAARNPWMGLERQSFEQVARWLKDTRDVEIYPSFSMIHAAQNRGEIDEAFLKMALQRWLDSQSLDLPREVAERFCRAALKRDDLPSNLLATPGLKCLVEKLSDLEPLDTEKHSLKPLSLCLEKQGGERVAHTLDHHLIKWCKLFLDESQAAWSLPNREEGFYRAWHRLVLYDPALSHEQRQRLKDWPQEANTALKEALFALEIPHSEIQDYLEAHLISLPGWAGMMLWRSQQSTQENSLLTEYLAVRISLEWALLKPYLPLPKQKNEDKVPLVPLIAAWAHWGDLPIQAWSQLSSTEQKARLILAYRFDEMTTRRLWLEAWEQTHADQLSEMIRSKPPVSGEVKPALAQFVFCIDVRSEPFRRQLEKAGPFETYGMAGFFGLPIETSELGSEHTHSSLPVILKPQHRVKESSSAFELKQYEQRRQAAHSLNYTFKTMKQNLLTSLLLPEVSGPWQSLQMLARSFVPRSAGRAFRQLREAWLRKPSTELSLDHMHTSETELPVGFSEEEKVHYVRQALRMMGLTNHFAPLVVICGHGSYSTNNPYASALDCGACGGASGGFNARVLAALANLPKVREALATEGISIPEDTVFVAAEHVTTLDELHWLYVPRLSEPAQEVFDRIQAALPKVSHDANEERLSQLPNFESCPKNPKAEAHRFAEDWSEVRPEWGLANNAEFIIGRRELTKECNLGGRAFLHNYDWQEDQDGTLLANIIAGPATVAQWINLQYYASTVAPHYYGSGNKATQTVTAGLGVMQGNASDLLAGLPWQSVMQSDQEVYHAPLRLLVVIEAPREYVERLVDHDPAFRQKVQNGWIRLANIDPEGYWESWS
ncbi:DUF2309 domain-containing protein [Paludifilum halophilum]|uniref:Probable inorganic carbon transporter subunit DabA n=1 Tax=Paludifilum halophilum TaxID=1642702 RepID=A0A235BBC7_9BACL|nr:putative inorganic carbon transporter subunit DabA [Paludifilum halophilum]OYD09593.1 hypothetical protein CHM34_00855 [Paludifilum halophilum]